MSKLYRNWPAHNLIGHPIGEIASWVLGDAGWRFFHDGTLPPCADTTPDQPFILSGLLGVLEKEMTPAEQADYDAFVKRIEEWPSEKAVNIGAKP